VYPQVSGGLYTRVRSILTGCMNPPLVSSSLHLPIKVLQSKFVLLCVSIQSELDHLSLILYKNTPQHLQVHSNSARVVVGQQIAPQSKHSEGLKRNLYRQHTGCIHTGTTTSPSTGFTTQAGSHQNIAVAPSTVTA